MNGMPQAKVDISKVKAYCNLPPYLNLVKQIIKRGEGEITVSRIEGEYAQIRAWKYDILGDVRVPLNSLTILNKVEAY